ncbi:hypothetical protein ACJMK2_013574 [Sinanodonta woodiana]|uniref:Uncharacterized protein n=1 Tax=Sinanodonta woodiana TaxID=1069815 RepID=A0ABD3UXW9_SINWO
MKSPVLTNFLDIAIPFYLLFQLDLTVISYMQIFPKLGDRTALKLFVGEEFKKKKESQYQGKERKTKHCHDRAPAEFQDKRISESSLKWRKRTMARHCNRNAFKENRKLELGWIHNGKHVRTAKGGVTRKIELPSNSRKEEVLDKAKTFFPPTNHAPLGSIVDFVSSFHLFFELHPKLVSSRNETL